MVREKRGKKGLVSDEVQKEIEGQIKLCLEDESRKGLASVL